MLFKQVAPHQSLGDFYYFYVCNFTNIHNYPAYALACYAFSPTLFKEFLYESTSALLKNAPNCLVMFAVSEDVGIPDDESNLKTIRFVGNLTTLVSEGL